MSIKNAIETVSNDPQNGKKYFTIAEANRALPYVSKIVNDVTKCYLQIMDMRQTMAYDPEKPCDQHASQAEYEKAMDHLSDLLDELRQVGVELKDFEKGLLDFPAVHEGREISLCWHRGEQCVGAWHELDAGFAGRKAVSLLEEG